jgi:hypothetical protein
MQRARSFIISTQPYNRLCPKCQKKIIARNIFSALRKTPGSGGIEKYLRCVAPDYALKLKAEILSAKFYKRSGKELWKYF